MSAVKEIQIRELNVDMIPPSSVRYLEPEYGGSKIVVVGKPGTGKSTIIASLLYAKKHLIPTGIVMSGSEDSNGFYSKMFPESFVFNEYDEEQLKLFVKRQKMAKLKSKNPWAVVLCDDCTDSAKIFNSKLQQGLYKRGRHWKMWYILSLQYAMDINPAIRTNVDGVFILREPILKNRKVLFENYASIIGDFNIFCELMDQLTTDYSCMYIHNAGQSNSWQECVFFYKATPPPSNFKFGCKEYWKHHHSRFDKNYKNELDF
jgi:energy-coupling factor transporter ATP-binding protein EcfA2